MRVPWRKIGRGIAWFILGAVLLLFLFNLEENWRGARDWAACQKELQAKGEVLDFRQLAPPGKPEDDLSKVPIFAESYRRALEPANAPYRAIRLDGLNVNFKSSALTPKSGDFRKGQPIDLSEWQRFYRSTPAAHLPAAPGTPAQDVLLALSQFDPEMKEIETALENPNAYWPLNEEKPLLTPCVPITAMLQVSRILNLRGVAYLNNNEADLAAKDYLFSFDIDRALVRNCDLLNFLVMVADRALIDGILWEGIHRHAWNEAQLQEMDSALASVDLLPLAQKALRTERASMLQNITVFQQWDSGTKRQFNVLYGNGIWRFFHLRPRGWWDEDRCNSAMMVQRHIDAIDVPAGTIKKIAPQPKSTLKIFYTPYTEMVRSSFEDKLDSRIAEAEANLRLSRMACRLEEYYLVQKQYPEKLDELSDLPAHLNQEVLSENSLHYQRKGEGYLLYSPGWDQTDHGGKGREIGQADDHYDWIWPSP